MTLAAEEPFVRWDWVRDHTADIVDLFWEHLTLTATAVAIGFVLSMAMALAAIRWRRTYAPLAGLAGLVYAIPSVALFGLLVPIPFFGLGYRTALLALTSYTLLILLRNIVAGLDGVPPAVREAADGMGYEPWRRMLHVDLPLAAPAIVAGLRIATVTTVGLVTVTSLVGAGGFGDLITDGLSRDFSTPIVVGAVLSVVLAVALDIVFVVVERLLTPWARARAPRATPVVRGAAP
ncbi:MAG TPA: ABC transporter permease [Acidimicrobiales bacterium]|nr:ABC transporter permease [Acidimicrobiales bacterium]